MKLGNTPIKEKIKVIVTGSDVKHIKPYPDIYLKAAELLDLHQEECLAFEDTSPGVESATSAGLLCIAIPTEHSIHQDFSKACHKSKNLKEAVDYLKENGMI